MKEKKFHIISIALAAAAIILVVFTLAGEGILAAAISLIICRAVKDTYRVKIGVVLSIIAILGAVLDFIIYYVMYTSYDITGIYWLFDRLVGA
ncbi:MAG: hypothetical protein IJ007_03780 [Oscillospiraceae bacterium]|nr:hypothetical protein [Oscillospiraceae bacterium]